MILRVSDLSSILNQGISEDIQHVWSIDEAIAAIHESETLSAQLSSTLIEFSWKTTNDESPYASKSVPFSFISAYIQYDILHGDYDFTATKSFLNGVNIIGTTNFTGPVNVVTGPFTVDATSASISADAINLNYKNTLVINWENDDGVLEPVMTFSKNGEITFHKSVTMFETSKNGHITNAVKGTMTHALWS